MPNTAAKFGTTFRSLSARCSCALALASLAATPVQAAFISATQTVNAEYVWFDGVPLGPPPSREEGFVNETFTQLGNYAFPTRIEGFGTNVVRWTTDLDNNGLIRTKTELELSTAGRAPNETLGRLDITADNTVAFSDQVRASSADDRIFRFQTRITGQLDSETRFSPLATSRLSGGMIITQKVDLVGVLTGGGTPAVTEIARRSIVTPPGPAPTQGNFRGVDLELLFIDILYTGAPKEFSFSYSDSLFLRVDGIEASTFSALIKNDFMSTVTTYASVFTTDGVLLPDERVISSDGFEYDVIPGLVEPNPNPVPLPSSLLLIVAGLLGLRLSTGHGNQGNSSTSSKRGRVLNISAGF